MNLDTKTLTIMVITIVIAEIVKRLVGGALDRLKISNVIINVSTKVKPLLNKFVFAAIIDCCSIMFILYLALSLFSSSEPATKHDLLALLVLCFGLIIFSISLVHDYIGLKLHIHINAKNNP